MPGWLSVAAYALQGIVNIHLLTLSDRLLRPAFLFSLEEDAQTLKNSHSCAPNLLHP
jgi:hypothetical protein